MEERRLRGFRKKVLGRIFVSTRCKVTGKWIKIYIMKLNYQYFSPNIFMVIKSKRMRWVGHLARMEERSGMYRILVVKLEGERPLERPKCRWVYNIKMDL
jgi:hypothetical protein